METRKRLGEARTKLGTVARRSESPRVAGGRKALREQTPWTAHFALFWPGLWRLAARGHYHLTQHQSESNLRIGNPSSKGQLPQLEREGTHSRLPVGRAMTSPCAQLPWPPEPPCIHLVGIRESVSFGPCSDAHPEGSTPHWDGEHFFGYTAKPEDEREKGKDFWFRAHDNGITFGFAEKEWKSVQALFRRAWEVQEVRMAWDGLGSNTVSYEERCLRHRELD